MTTPRDELDRLGYEGVGPEEILKFLRWGPDSKIVNHFGEHVWLRKVTHEEWVGRARAAGLDENAGDVYPNGFTEDCCFVEAPCEHHASLDGKS